MKKLSLFNMALLLAGVLFAQGSRAEDYTRWVCPTASSPAWAKEVSVGATGRWPIRRTVRGWL